MAGFNPLLAIGAGLAGGIESAEAGKRARQDKIDDDYRKRALDLNYETQLYSAKKKIDNQQAQGAYSAISSAAAANKANTTNQATFDALKNNMTKPEIAQDNMISDDTPAPTNTPQTSVTMQPMANTVQGGMNSPQGGPVPLQMTPEQGDAINPLKAPNQQSQIPVDNSLGNTYADKGDDLVTDSFGNTLTRSQQQRAIAYGYEENAKLKGALVQNGDGTAAYQIGLGRVLKEDKKLGTGIANEGLNKTGFEIGTVPSGLVAPAIPEKFLPTSRMNANQGSIKIRKDEEQLLKDKDAAINANRAATEFAMYLSGNESGDSGGLNKIGFIRDFTGAMSAKDATLDSVNKSLTFNIVGFERTPGMRLTQAEFFIAREAMPGRGNTPEANKNIAQFWQAKLRLPQEYAQFKQDFMTANNGEWSEAIGDRMFQQYQHDNPILDPKILEHPDQAQLSDFKLNENRQSLEQYAESGGWSKLGFLGVKPPQAAAPAREAGMPVTQGETNQAAPEKGGVVSYQEYFK